MASCEMKGLLSFLVLWLIKKRPLTGMELASELERRKGTRPSPGTIYPVLKELTQKGLLQAGSGKRYSLTRKGERELESLLVLFFETFSDVDEMRSCCKK